MSDDQAPPAEFRSARLRGRLTVVLLGASVLVSVLGALLQLMLLELLARMESGEEWSMEEANSLEAGVDLLATVKVALMIVTAIAFLMWLFRSMHNLRALGITNCRYTPGWAVGWWFVPMMNLIAPPQVMGDLWRASTLGTSAADWKSARFPPLVGWWWGLFILSHFSGFVVSLMMNDKLAEVGQIQQLVAFSLVNELSWLVAGLLAVLIVRRIYLLQDEKSANRL